MRESVWPPIPSRVNAEIAEVGVTSKNWTRCRLKLKSDDSVAPSRRTWSRATVESEQSCRTGTQQSCWERLCLDPTHSNSVLSALSLRRLKPHSIIPASCKPGFRPGLQPGFHHITSHHMEKTEAGLKGLCIREIMTKYTLYYTKYYTIILRFPMPWRSAL